MHWSRTTNTYKVESLHQLLLVSNKASLENVHEGSSHELMRGSCLILALQLKKDLKLQKVSPVWPWGKIHLVELPIGCTGIVGPFLQPDIVVCICGKYVYYCLYFCMLQLATSASIFHLISQHSEWELLALVWDGNNQKQKIICHSKIIFEFGGFSLNLRWSLFFPSNNSVQGLVAVLLPIIFQRIFRLAR